MNNKKFVEIEESDLDGAWVTRLDTGEVGVVVGQTFSRLNGGEMRYMVDVPGSSILCLSPSNVEVNCSVNDDAGSKKRLHLKEKHLQFARRGEYAAAGIVLKLLRGISVYISDGNDVAWNSGLADWFLDRHPKWCMTRRMGFEVVA